MSTVYLLDPSSTLVTNIVTKAGSKMSIGNQSLPSAPNTAGAIVLNVQGPTSSNNVSAFQIPADTSANRPTTNYPGYIRYNTTNNSIEFWSGTTSSWQPISAQPPSIASVSPSLVTDQAGGNIVTITGSNFVATPSVFFVDNQSLSTAASSVTFNSSSQLTATFPTSLLPNSNLEPYSVRVTNLSSGLSSTLGNCINVNQVPYWSPSNSLGSPTVLTVDGSVNLTKSSIGTRCIAIDPETPPVDLSYSLTNDTSQNLVPANVTLDISGYLISTSTPRLASATSYSFQVYARERTGDSTSSAIGYFNLSVNGYYPLLSFSALSGLTVTIGYVDNNGLNYTTSGPYTATPPGYTIYTIQCTNSATASTVVSGYTVTKGGTTGTGTITYPTTVNGGCPSFLTCFILAGGGGGGGNQAGSGGGAGGLLYNQCYSLSGLAGTQASIQVGQGGTSAAEPAMNSGINGGQGVNSFLGPNIATGGAGGMTMSITNNIVAGASGGSGSGGSAWTTTGSTGAGGSGTNQLTITSQGNAGGSANNVAATSGHSSGGGGGAAGPGTITLPKWTSGATSYTVMNAGSGGNGLSTTITGSSLQVAGGGGGGCYYGTAGNGGVGGGGGGLSNNSNSYSAAIPPNGAAGSPATDKNGAPNTGGGGGGGGLSTAAGFPASSSIAGNGGCGIMILRHVSFIVPAVLNDWTIALTGAGQITTTTIYLNNAGSLINSGAGPAVNGGYTVLVFTSTGNGNTGTCTFTPTTNIGPNVSYLVCAGGGSGGQGSAGGGQGGGGGGGVLLGTAFPVSINTGYQIQVGRGGLADNGGKGPGANNTTSIQQGVNSTIFGTITAYGGGGSGCGNVNGTLGGSPGGCGGGGGEFQACPAGLGTVGQGYAGGAFNGVSAGFAAGGGGAGGPGGYSTQGGAAGSVVGAGGPGLPSTITGTLVYYGGGGGASGNSMPGSAAGLCGPSPFTSAGAGGSGSGGTGTPTSGVNGYGGGGGGTYLVGAGSLTGGGGTVIIRFPSYTMS